MKKTIIVLCLGLISNYVFGQKHIENKVLKDNEKIGKIIKLKKHLTITDESGDFNFRWPRGFTMSEDGFIFIEDRDALYKFTSKGKYLKNLFKKGGGPGELDFLYNFFIDNDSIIMYSHITSKVVKTDFNGKLKKEFKLPGGGMKLLMVVTNGKYFYRKISTKEMDQGFKAKKGERVLNYKYQYWDEKKSKVSREHFIFPEIMTYEKQRNGGTLSGSKNRLHYSWPIDGIQFFSNSPDYKIMKLDINSMMLSGTFNRKYQKVRFYPKPLEAGQKMTPDLKKLFSMKQYKEDILKLSHRGDELWVTTSTFIKNRGILVDVYGLNGIYKNKFYIPLRSELMSKGFVYFSIVRDMIVVYDENEEGNAIVVIYKMEI